jgi:(R,R)-butanediol dehydrogenase/meso-butanediol dehydrogenase/diacetyl reductase
MLLAQRDLALVGTWCYPVTDFPRIAGLIASGRFPVEKIVTARIAIDDIIEQGFETLLSPAGDQVKVLVNARG